MEMEKSPQYIQGSAVAVSTGTIFLKNVDFINVRIKCLQMAKVEKIYYIMKMLTFEKYI